MRQYPKQKFLSCLELPELVSFAMQISIYQKQSAVLLFISMASFGSTLLMEQ
jgi:hypothetical protein